MARQSHYQINGIHQYIPEFRDRFLSHMKIFPLHSQILRDPSVVSSILEHRIQSAREAVLDLLARHKAFFDKMDAPHAYPCFFHLALVQPQAQEGVGSFQLQEFAEIHATRGCIAIASRLLRCNRSHWSEGPNISFLAPLESFTFTTQLQSARDAWTSNYCQIAAANSPTPDTNHMILEWRKIPFSDLDRHTLDPQPRALCYSTIDPLIERHNRTIVEFKIPHSSSRPVA